MSAVPNTSGAFQTYTENASDMPELVKLLAEAQSEMKPAVFDGNNSFFTSKYATLGSVIDAVRGPLTSRGIAYIQRAVEAPEKHAAVETVFYYGSASLATGAVCVPVAKFDAHGFGSALTYAKRYSLAMACGVYADDDDDGNAAVGDKRRSTSAAQDVLDEEKPLTPEQEAVVKEYVSGLNKIYQASKHPDAPDGIETEAVEVYREARSEHGETVAIAVYKGIHSTTRTWLRQALKDHPIPQEEK